MSTVTVSPLRQRMIEDMNARKLCAGTQRGHIHSCKRFAAFLKRSPDTATAEDIRRWRPVTAWVKLRSPGVQPASRLYPQLRTWPCAAQTDALCHEETYVLRQTAPFDPSTGELTPPLCSTL